MSVLIPDDQVFNYLCSGLEKAAFNRTCDEWWSHRIHSHFKDKDVEAEAKRLVESWMELNDMSYSVRYSEEPETKIKLRRKTLHKPMQVHQLLKYAQCVNYNIEKDTIESAGNMITKQGKSDLWLLEKWIIDISMSIVDKMPEYKEASWSD